MKRISIIITILFLTSTVIHAQSPTATQPAENKMAEKGEKHKGKFKELNLTPEQKAKMKELRDKHREEMKAQKKQHREEMKAVLTPEQQAKFQEMREKRHEGNREFKRNNPKDVAPDANKK